MRNGCTLRIRRTSRWLAPLLATVSAVLVLSEEPAAAVVSPAGGSSVSTTAEEDACCFAYDMGLPVPADVAFEENASDIKHGLKRAKRLGINVGGQYFLTDSRYRDWDAYLDVAEEQRLTVIAWFKDSPPVWNGTRFELGKSGAFLRKMRDHPALHGFFLYDEPFEVMDAEQLRQLYSQGKRIAPDVPIVIGFSRQIWKAEAAGDESHAFSDGMCDICHISALEFRNYGDGDIFYRDVLIANHTVSRSVIRERDPDAEIWTSVQVFGGAGHSTYYMPSPEELQEMVDLLLSPELQAAGELDGMTWQNWTTELTPPPGSPTWTAWATRSSGSTAGS
jgi:hypothetical protein